MWGVVLLTLVGMSLPHGPYAEDVRFRQGQEALKDIGRFGTSARSSLFQSVVADLESNIGEEQTDEEIFKSLPNLSCFVKKSYRIISNRFMG